MEEYTFKEKYCLVKTDCQLYQKIPVAQNKDGSWLVLAKWKLKNVKADESFVVDNVNERVQVIPVTIRLTTEGMFYRKSRSRDRDMIDDEERFEIMKFLEKMREYYREQGLSVVEEGEDVEDV